MQQPFGAVTAATPFALVLFLEAVDFFDRAADFFDREVDEASRLFFKVSPI
jgi:hypothetical protein